MCSRPPKTRHRRFRDERIGPRSYGVPLMASGDCAYDNPFGFSTKYEDGESALVYYGFRYYAPGVGRWTSRDPIGEKGFVVSAFIRLLAPWLIPGTADWREAGGRLRLEYAYVQNRSIDRTDYLGLAGDGALCLCGLVPADPFFGPPFPCVLGTTRWATWTTGCTPRYTTIPTPRGPIPCPNPCGVTCTISAKYICRTHLFPDLRRGAAWRLLKTAVIKRCLP